MINFLIFASVVAYCSADGYSNGYGGNGYSSGGYGGGYGSGYGSGLGGNNYGYSGDNYGSSQQNYGGVQAAIASRRTVDIKPVSLHQDPIYPQVLEVAPLELPIQIIYNSKSSPVLVHQNHIPGAKGQLERTQSEEEPHKVIHEVLRPVIQEVREVITPYRRVVQEIQPVIESAQTVVSKGERTQNSNNYGYSADNNGYSPKNGYSSGGVNGNGYDNNRSVVKEVQPPVIESLNSVVAKVERALSANNIPPSGGYNSGDDNNYGLAIGFESLKTNSKAKA